MFHMIDSVGTIHLEFRSLSEHYQTRYTKKTVSYNFIAPSKVCY